MRKLQSKRIIYLHFLTIEFQSEFLKGRILDISNYGLQFFSYTQLDAREPYGVRFHIEKNKDEDSEVWSREGEVRWINKHEEGYLMGIEFNPELDQLPAVHQEGLLSSETYIERILETFDMYQLFIYPKTLEQQVKKIYKFQ